MRAALLYEARLLAGHDDDEESVEAAAGALLAAETAVEIHQIHTIAKEWAEAHRKG